MGSTSPISQRIRQGVLGLDPVVPRPTFDEALKDRLEGQLEEAVGPLVDSIVTDRALWIGKYQLGRVHKCEGLYAAQKDEDFVWTLPMIRGRVAHRAIEASIMLGEKAPPPMHLVERGLERLAEGEEQQDLADFINAMEPLDRSRVVSEANDAVVRFQTDWPALQRAWMPRVESKARARLQQDRLVLAATYDLALSQPKGMEARVIIVDFKTGSPSPGHAEDLRFYALVETLRSGVPPFRVASYYLEEGTFQAEAVTEEMLDAALRRTADGVRAMAELMDGRDPKLHPGMHCRYCPRKNACDEGTRYIASLDGSDDG